MKKHLGKFAVLFAILLMVSSAAYGWDNVEHVKAAPNGKGDLIIFPYYFTANGGWETKITIQNTSLTYSTVSKIIFRSHYYSEELLDFLIYLTPADVWTGYLRNDGNRTYIYSDDDSALSSATTWASPAAPINQALYPPTCTTLDSRDWGYIEVIESWYADVSGYTVPFPLQAGESAVRPVSKSYVKRIYDAWLNSVTIDGTLANGDPGLPRLTNVASTDHTINVLAAHAQFQNPLIGGQTAAMRAYVFADFDCRDQLDSSVVTGLQTVNARNTIGELEAAMAKDNLALPYVNDPEKGALSVFMITFPTKISQFDTSCRYVDGIGPFWDDPTVPVDARADEDYAALRYNLTYFDMKENSEVATQGPYSGGDPTIMRFKEEVNLLTTSDYSSLYKEGWTNINFVYTNRLNNPTNFCTESAVAAGTCVVGQPYAAGTFHYYSAPALTSVIKFVNAGIKMMEGAWTDGEVFAEFYTGAAPVYTPYTNPPVIPASWLPDYQYFNDLNALGLESY